MDQILVNVHNGVTYAYKIHHNNKVDNNEPKCYLWYHLLMVFTNHIRFQIVNTNVRVKNTTMVIVVNEHNKPVDKSCHNQVTL